MSLVDEEEMVIMWEHRYATKSFRFLFTLTKGRVKYDTVYRYEGWTLNEDGETDKKVMDVPLFYAPRRPDVRKGDQIFIRIYEENEIPATKKVKKEKKSSGK